MSPNRPGSAEHPKEMISAYLDGQLEAPDRERVFEHLRDCAACRELLSDFRALAAAARREGVPPVPADLAERIGRRIDAEPADRFTHRWFPLTRARLPLATAAAVLLVSSLWIVWRGRLPGESPAGPQPGAGPAPALVPDVPRAPSPSRTPVPFPPPPPPAPLPMKTAPRLEEAAPPGERVPQAQPSQEGKKAATVLREAISAPEENPDLGAAATARGQEGSAAVPQALESGAAGYAVAPATAGSTLVFVMPEGRVSILPDARIILASGDYLCTLRAGGPGEDEALAELRAEAARRTRPAARSDSTAETLPGDLVIPAPPGSGPLPPDLAAQMHRRVRTLVRERLLARAEAQCGPAPPALRGIR